MSSTAAKSFLRKVNNPYSKGSHLHFTWENGFNEGFESSQANSCFEENDLIDFGQFIIDKIANFLNSSDNEEDGKNYTMRDLLNLWIQSKSN